MDLDRAKTVAMVASVLVDTARVENDYLKITGQDHSTFLELATGEQMPSANNPFPSVVRHRLEG